MSEQRRIRQLEALYATLPEVGCRGLCGASICGPVPVTALERKRIVAAAGEREQGNLDCPYLDRGRCSVYALRPLICRLWGAVDERRMTCPFGCSPARKFTREEARAIIDRGSAIGGASILLGNTDWFKQDKKRDQVAEMVWTPCRAPGCKEASVFFSWNMQTGEMDDSRCDDHITPEQRRNAMRPGLQLR